MVIFDTEHIFLDLETTGLSPERDRIIDVAAVRVVGDEVLDRFEQLVDPGRPLSLAIRELTGLDDGQLRGKPRIDAVLPGLLAFIGRAPIVGHVIDFDRAFIEAAAGRPVENRFLDTCELACIARPNLREHRLEALHRTYGLTEPPSHRAMDDTLAAFRVARAILEELLDGRRGFLERARALLGEAWAWSPMLDKLLPHATRSEPKRPEVPLHFGVQEEGEEERSVRLDAEAVCSELRHGGALGRAKADFEERHEQIEMAGLVCRAFNEDRSLMVEAGTGVGKSLAYLVPAVHWAASGGGKVVVSTYTRALQDQIIAKDVPEVAEALDVEFRAGVIKGRANYLCLRKLTDLVESVDLASAPDFRLACVFALSWAELTADGDLSHYSRWLARRLPALGRVWRRLRSEADGCLGKRCAHRRTCHYFAAVAVAHQADIIVANHSLTLQWPARHPRFDRLILDEAHNLEDAATTAYGAEVEEDEIAMLLTTLGGTRKEGGFLASAGRRLQREREARDKRDEIAATVDRAAGAVSEVLSLLGPLGEAVLAYVDKHSGAEKESLGATVRITESAAAGELWEVLSARASSFCDALESSAGAILALHEILVGLESGAQAIEGMIADLQSHAESLRQTAWLAASVVRAEAEDFVHWIRTWRAGGRKTWGLYAAPVRVGPMLHRDLYSARTTTILTSATLSTGGTFEYMDERIGFSLIPAEERLPESRLGSPFDFRRNTVIGVPTDLAGYRTGPAFIADVARTIYRVAVMLGGRTLALFNAVSRMRAVERALRPALESRGIRLLCQGRDGRSAALVESLRGDGRGVLLGTRSFWEGVDVPGRALSCVIIEKLPFPHLHDPVVEARNEEAQARTGNAFFTYYLPLALLGLEQGAGRLIRGHDDRGAVLILDSGLPRKRYSDLVFRSLPEGERLIAPADRVLEALAERFTRWYPDEPIDLALLDEEETEALREIAERAGKRPSKP